MSSKSKPVYAWVYRNGALWPEMEYDRQAVVGMKEGQRVKLNISQWRNLDRLRAYWCTLQDCVDATGCAPTKEALDAYVRSAVGHVDAIRLANGMMVGIARPINTRKCDEPEMIAFFQAVEEYLASEFGFVSEHKTDQPHQSEKAA